MTLTTRIAVLLIAASMLLALVPAASGGIDRGIDVEPYGSPTRQVVAVPTEQSGLWNTPLVAGSLAGAFVLGALATAVAGRSRSIRA